MLIELAIGDAYGAGFESVRGGDFVDRKNDLSGYIQHPWHRLPSGSYTDDTQMSIAIAELVLAETDWTPVRIAERFLEAFHRDPRKGYSKRFQAFLENTHTGADFLANMHPESDKSGAAMRAAPIGVYPDTEEVLSRCAMQAAVTHNTPDGIHAAQAAALMSHYFLYDLGPKSELTDFLCAHVPGNWKEPWEGEVGSKGWMSVRAAITSLLTNDSLSGILRGSIAWSGDTDTVATIALAAASCSRDMTRDLPPVLIQNLENGTYGREYLEALDGRLMAFLADGFL
jgi:ADP-ribosylglycohydrolase